MSIDIYESDSLKLSIPEDSFVRLQEAQRELHAKTGRWIDAYGTSTISPAHAQLWLSGLTRIRSVESDPITRQSCADLIALMQDAIARDITLIIEGD